jgi:PAS domain S-box-containing protein
MSKKRVLVVEDQAVAAKITCRSLQKLGYEVAAVVGTGEEAVHATAEIRPDVVLMDIQLEGGINGIEAAAQIRAQLDVPVVYLTAYADESILQQAKITAPFGYILKPFRERELHINIEIALHRHMQERKLRESERKYRELVQNANSIILRVTPQWDITFFNEFAQSFFGYTEDEILGRNAVGTIVPESEATGRNLVQLMDDIVSRPEQYRYNENENMRSNGEHIWVAWANNAIVDEEGRVIEVLCIGTDITERKRTEAELIRRENNLATLVAIQQQLLDPDWEGDDYGEILAQLGQIAQVSRVYIFENSHDADGQLVTSQRAEWCAPGIKPEIDNPELQNVPYDMIPRWAEVLGQGNIISGLVSGFPESERQILEPQNIQSLLVLPLMVSGEFFGFIGFDDCSEPRRWGLLETSLLQSAAVAISLAKEKQQAGKALQESYERFATVMNSMDALMYVADMATYELLFVNQRTRDLFGDVESKICWQALQSGQTAPCAFCTNEHLVANDQPTGVYTWEFQNTTTGRWYYIQDQAIRWTDGRLVRLEIATDITERRRTEEQVRRRNRELAELNAIIGTLTSTLALEQVLQRIVEAVPHFFPNAHSATIQLLEENGGLATQAASESVVAGDEPMVFRPGEGIAGWAVQERRPVNVPDVTYEPRFRPGLSPPVYRSLLAVPLIAQEQILGALSIAAAQVGAFSAQDEQLFLGLAGYVAIAVQNARLYEQTRRDAETKARLLQEVNHRVQNNLSTIIGLLYAEKRHAVTSKQDAYRAVMEDLINRIQGMATVHGLLSASAWEPLLLSELATQVVHAPLRSLPSDKRVFVQVSPVPVRVNSKQASSLALVFNELVTNVVKYALQGRSTAHIAVHIDCADDHVLCEFRDDGPGYPEEVLCLERYNVGLYLLQTIVRDDLNGELLLRNDGGAVAVITFKIAE